jgi:SAM-dependent methyltransferase
MNQTWYADFFHGIVVDMWRTAVSSEQTRLEADFLEQCLQLQARQRVLDVPCGFGRHSIDLARRGYRMTGADVSAEMIEEARRLAVAGGCDIEWRNVEMRDIAAQSEFDGAYCFGNSFGYLDREGMRRFLRVISAALKSGSRFAFDYGMAAESILPRFTEREWAPINDIYFLENNRYHIAESCIETTYTFVRDGSVETRSGFHWVYTVREIRTMLDEAGFTVLSMYKSIDCQPFELGAPVLIVVAEKR